MVMVGQSQRLREPLRWTRAGKITVAVAAAIVAVAGVVLVVALAKGTAPLRPGCVSVTFASTVGGASVHACGAKARTDCADPARSTLGTDRQSLEAACERAKLPFGAARG